MSEEDFMVIGDDTLYPFPSASHTTGSIRHRANDRRVVANKCCNPSCLGEWFTESAPSSCPYCGYMTITSQVQIIHV